MSASFAFDVKRSISRATDGHEKVNWRGARLDRLGFMPLLHHWIATTHRPCRVQLVDAGDLAPPATTSPDFRRGRERQTAQRSFETIRSLKLEA
jgi:hypothetical protein